MTERTAEALPSRKGRIAGLFYLLMMLSGGLATFARNGLVVAGDATATATRILAHEPMYRLGYAGDLLVVANYVVVTALFYDLFRPVNRRVAVLAAFFALVGCAIQGFACFFELAPLVALGGARYLSVFTEPQLQALAFLSLKLYGQAYSVALPFFAFYGLVIGYLIFKSTFLPRFLGVMMVVAGSSWLTFLSPSFGARILNPYLLVLGVGEGLLTLWLIVFGANAQRWREQAATRPLEARG
jgi:hypothetical protein